MTLPQKRNQKKHTTIKILWV